VKTAGKRWDDNTYSREHLIAAFVSGLATGLFGAIFAWQLWQALT